MQTYKVKADVMLSPISATSPQEKPVQFIVTADNKDQAKVKANAYMLKQYNQKLGNHSMSTEIYADKGNLY